MSSLDQSTPKAISGIDVMRGVGAERAKGFWADAWDRVVRRPSAIVALTWIGIVAFFAVFSPLLANGHPLLMREMGPDGEWAELTSPLLRSLATVDILLIIGTLVGAPLVFLPLSTPRSIRLSTLIAMAMQAGITAIAAAVWGAGGFATWIVISIACALPFVWLCPIDRTWLRLTTVALVAGVCSVSLFWGQHDRLVDFESYVERELAGTIETSYTIIPWSPDQARTDLYVKAPLSHVRDHIPAAEGTKFGERTFLLGTDGVGRDVMSQMMHACRLSISIGLVSTGIALVIGVTIGALMGYFGGWVDLALYRVVEIFMAIPVLFLLIVAVAVLPRNTYVMMAIIGCVTWTGAARFTRAEFYKLRGQDFVQAARALGLPLRSILFRHMLPNGVTPVLVDASFAVAAAILAEATLSYLGLGPEGQASWGKLLSNATSTLGAFIWWLAIFPGLAIFLTVLSYNLLGEAMRDAIDPKLRKAAH